MSTDSATGRRSTDEIEITPEMIEVGEDEIYQHLSLEPGSGNARECAGAVFAAMMNAARPKYRTPSR